MGKFADMVSNGFYIRISCLKEEYKEYKDREIVLILVNSSNKKCIIVKEENLDNDIQERFDRIVLLLKYKCIYCGYTNVHFKFIGIFNKSNVESMIEYENIAIKKIELWTSGGYNLRFIKSSELVFIYNPFSSYLKKVFSPIKKSIKKALPKGISSLVLFDNVDDDLSFHYNLTTISTRYDILDDFEEYLKTIEEIDEKMNNLYHKKFNPDDYSN